MKKLKEQLLMKQEQKLAATKYLLFCFMIKITSQKKSQLF